MRPADPSSTASRAQALAGPLASPLIALWVGLALLLAGCGDGARSERARATCDALADERFEDAVALSDGELDAIGSDRETAECRCIAFLSLGDKQSCTELLAPLLAAPTSSDWIPHPVLSKLMVRTWQELGEIEQAARLATRVAPEAREDLDLLQLELMLRSRLEGEEPVLAALEARLEDDPSWIPQRLVLALSWTRRSRYDEALRVLGETPPPADHPLLMPWFESRIQAQASAGDLAAVQASFDAWRETGWDPVDLDARYALRLSVDQLVDPRHDIIDLLREALATQTELRDRNIVWGLHRRLIAQLLAAGRPEEALAAYDEAVKVVRLEGITREEIERAVARANGSTVSADVPARLRFQVPKAAAGGSLRLSPEPGRAPDAGYRTIALTGAEPVEVETRRGDHARRYVLRDAEGRVRASGALWPEPGATLEVRPVPGPPAVPRSWRPADRPAADGRRRVFAILADCADWRITEYLRERGELPFEDHLFDEGFRAVLESRPAFTAAALQSLVWPAPARNPGSLGWIHHLGLELAGLESVGRNPIGWLSLLLPERPNLFETLGAGNLVTANMLLAHGRIDAGRHAEVIGPRGDRRPLPSQDAYRMLRTDEIARHPALVQDADVKKFAETIAAEMDAADQIARDGEVDFLFLRLEALDLITHAHFGPLDGRGQDDAAGPLTATYRYIDDRLAQLHALLDQDDWLIFLSDHGIRSSMQHEEDAIFVALGDGVPRGRARGKPSLRGVPRSLAAMLGVETRWPESGATPWLTASTAEGEPEARLAAGSPRLRDDRD
jgi:tetratricopeptide (TPR) repeat protein